MLAAGVAQPVRQGCVLRKQGHAPFGTARPCSIKLPRQVMVRASPEDADAELEKRLEKLRSSKGATPYGKGVKAVGKAREEEEVKPVKKGGFDYTGEVVYYEGPPHRGDLALNLALGGTLLWLPLTFAAVGRAIFLNYRFTDKRISITTTTPLNVEQIDVAYQNVKDVISIGRFIGVWGDLLITLRDNAKVELRSVDRYLELKKYILERRDAMAPPSPLDEPGPTKVVSDPSKRGFST